MGYEQAYLSALELGLKTPSANFVEKFRDALELDEPDQEELRHALLQSRRRFVLPPQVSTETFQFCNALWGKIEEIHPAVIVAMLHLLRVNEAVPPRPALHLTRVRRTRRSESPM